MLTLLQQAFCLILLLFFLPETSAANILHRRAARLRKATGDKRLRSQSEIDTAHHTTRDRLLVLARAFTLTFTEPIVFVVDLYTALLYGVLFTWFESFPLVFGGIYGFNVHMQGLVYLGLFVAMLIVVPLYLLWVKLVLVPGSTKPTFRPEHVLPPTWSGALSLPICLFWYGWSARASVHWIVPIIGSSLFTIPLVTFFNGVLNYLGMSYPHYAASVFAGNCLFRALFGGIFPLFVSSHTPTTLILDLDLFWLSRSIISNGKTPSSTGTVVVRQTWRRPRKLASWRHCGTLSSHQFRPVLCMLFTLLENSLDLELTISSVRSQDQRNKQARTARC